MAAAGTLSALTLSGSKTSSRFFAKRATHAPDTAERWEEETRSIERNRQSVRSVKRPSISPPPSVENDKLLPNTESVEPAILEFISVGGTERVCRGVLENDLESPVYDKNMAAAVAHLCGVPEAAESQELLGLVVRLLSSSYKNVVQYAAQAIWFLAHNAQARKKLGDMWVVDGLVNVIKVIFIANSPAYSK